MNKRNPIMTLIPIFLALSLIGCQTTESSSKEQTVIEEEGIVFATVDGVELGKSELLEQGAGGGQYIQSNRPSEFF